MDIRNLKPVLSNIEADYGHDKMLTDIELRHFSMLAEQEAASHSFQLLQCVSY